MLRNFTSLNICVSIDLPNEADLNAPYNLHNDRL